MTFGSLFAGIGGMDLGLERAGMECKWQVEIDPFAQKVLAKHWPDAGRYDDIRTVCAFDEESWRTINEPEPVELLAGGFPCQDISLASATGVGIIGSRSGLWKEFARLVAELRPRFVLAENVPALRNRGLAMVLQDLWSLGYDAEWHCIPASSLGANHERDRIWIVAYPAGMFRKAIIWGEPERDIRAFPEDADVEGYGCGSRRPWRPHSGYSWQQSQPSSNAYLDGRRRHRRTGELRATGRHESKDSHSATHINRARLEERSVLGGDAATEQPPFKRNDSSDRENADAYSEPLVRAAIARGERHAWTSEPGVVRMVHGVSNRVDRLRCLGNSVVPQVVEWIGYRIMLANMGPQEAGALLKGRMA